MQDTKTLLISLSWFLQQFLGSHTNSSAAGHISTVLYKQLIRSHLSPNLTGRKTEAKNWEVSKAQHSNNNQTKITVLGWLQLIPQLMSPHIKKQISICRKRYIYWTIFEDHSAFNLVLLLEWKLVINPDGLNLGAKCAVPDPKQHLSTCN